MTAVDWIRGHRQTVIAGLALAAIAAYLVLRFGPGGFDSQAEGIRACDWPLLVALALGGTPLVIELADKARRGEFGSDLLAGMSILTAVALQEYLAGTLVVLMLSGGEALEAYAARSASSVLDALARRMPMTARRRVEGILEDIPLDAIEVGMELIVPPHEICPVDGTVVEGHGSMDESFLTGEPYRLSKAPGSQVLSGALNGESALAIRADRRAVDSRYAQIMKVMHDSEQRRPRMRRLGDKLGAWYTPLALSIAVAAAAVSGDMTRFLAVLVVATPCPLLIGIPTAIIGAISLCARRAIIVKDPSVLERVETCRVAIFDKTGTLTYGRPAVTAVVVAEDAGVDADRLLAEIAALERYSRHPLASAIVEEANARGLPNLGVERVEERPGLGLRGVIAGSGVELRVTGRAKLLLESPELAAALPPVEGGMECVALRDGRFAGLLRFRDRPRADGRRFVRHLGPKHQFERVLLVSGDRAEEVEYLAGLVGITEVHAEQSPEQKLEIVRRETARARTLFVGDGINDAPALAMATVGLAFGQGSDVTSEAAGAVLLEGSLEKIDEFLHIGRRMRRIALQSALGGMGASVLGMGLAAFGLLTPVAGALLQEVIDVVAVLNALRVAFPRGAMEDYTAPTGPTVAK